MKKLAIICILSGLIFTTTNTKSFANDEDQGYERPVQYQHQMNKGGGFNRENMHKKGDRFAEQLNLTSEQKEQSKKFREASREKIKPIIEQAKAERQKFQQLKESGASEQELKAQREKVKNIMQQAKKIHEENLKNFESILTPEQKTKFEQLKQERKQKMQQYKQGHKNFKQGNKE